MHSRKAFYTQAFTVSMLGALAVSLIIVIAPLLPFKDFTNYGTSYGPWLEEGLKYIIVLALFATIPFNIKAIPFIGVGFATVEAIRHIELIGYGSPRAFLAHLVFGLVMAFLFYLATKAKTTNLRGVLYALALLIPVALHLTYNIYLG